MKLLRRGAGAVLLVTVIALVAGLLGPVTGTSSRRWTFLHVMPADLALHGGPWAIEDETLVSREGDAPAVIVAPALAMRDFTASTRCRTASQCGLVFRYRNDTRYEIVRLDTNARRVVLASVTHGKELVLASAPAEANGQTWHQIRVDATAGIIRVALDGRRLIEASEGTFATSGLVGLWAPAAGVAYFDELSIGAVADSPRPIELSPILARPRG